MGVQFRRNTQGMHEVANTNQKNLHPSEKDMTTDPHGFSIQTIHLVAELQMINEELGRLEAANPEHTPFQSIEWGALFWKWLAPDDWRLYVFLVRDREGILRGAAPMCVVPDAFLRPATLKNLASVLGDYGDILVDPDYADAVCRALIPCFIDPQSSWSALEITNLPRSSPLVKAVERDKARLPRCELREETPTHRILLPENFGAFMAKLGRKFRENVQRRKRRLMADHNVTFRSVESTNELNRVVNGFIFHQKARFARQYKYGFFKDERREQFFREASEQFLKSGWLDLHYLTIDNNFGAAQFGLQLNDVRYNFQIAMNSEYRIHSPGTLVMLSSIERSIDQGIKVYDLLGGDMDYKLSFNTEAYPRRNFYWTKRPVISWANRRCTEIRKELESKIWLRRLVFKLGNKFGRQRSHGLDTWLP
jgi:CelD/BcsL family acetyltransferase involved in cellulose biosynthesis